LCLSTYVNEAMTIALWISVVKDLWGCVLFYFLVYWHFNLLTGCSSHSTLHCVLWCSLSPWVNTNCGLQAREFEGIWMVLLSYRTHNPSVGVILSRRNSGFGFENQSQFVFGS
jgi:hypothetical protein